MNHINNGDKTCVSAKVRFKYVKVQYITQPGRLAV